MKFRPCIDIHNGLVKQIVGASLTDQKDQAKENFISVHDAGWYAGLYKQHQLTGGHIILLNPASSPYYEADVAQARGALSAYDGGMQIGGGIHDENARQFLDWGASHVIVTSFVFKDGTIHMDRLKALCIKIGREHLVLDLSCRKRPSGNAAISDSAASGQPGAENAGAPQQHPGDYYIVTDRWQKFTSVPISEETFAMLEPYCAEFLIHAVDVEGKNSGIETELAGKLSRLTALPVTYAGGIHSMEDIQAIGRLGGGRMDFTVGSALDLFGGHLSFETLCQTYGPTAP